jgi:hypothetical protein
MAFRIVHHLGDVVVVDDCFGRLGLSKTSRHVAQWRLIVLGTKLQRQGEQKYSQDQQAQKEASSSMCSHWAVARTCDPVSDTTSSSESDHDCRTDTDYHGVRSGSATIVVRASDKEEVTEANLRASTSAQMTKLAQSSD